MQLIRILPVTEEEREKGILVADLEGQVFPVLIEFDRGYLIQRDESTILVLHQHAELVEEVDPDA